MSPTAPRLLALLCNGRLHSGAQLATALGISRAAVWKLVGELRAVGVPIESLSRRGYRLATPVELLDAARMRAAALELGRRLPEALEVHFLIDSTNEYLQASPPPPPAVARVTLAELQTAGRGRRGRRWIAPFGSGLTFSVAWTFAETPADLPAPAQRLAAVTALMATLWVTQAVPIAVTSLIPLVAFPLLGIQTAEDVSQAYVDENIFLFMGGFIIALGIVIAGAIHP